MARLELHAGGAVGQTDGHSCADRPQLVARQFGFTAKTQDLVARK